MKKIMNQNDNKIEEIEEYVGEYICPKCGKPANGYKIGDCLRILCPSCGCDAVTTYFDEFDLDEQVYKLELLNNDPTILNIKAFASIFKPWRYTIFNTRLIKLFFYSLYFPGITFNFKILINYIISCF